MENERVNMEIRGNNESKFCNARINVNYKKTKTFTLTFIPLSLGKQRGHVFAQCNDSKVVSCSLIKFKYIIADIMLIIRHYC